MMWLPLVKGLLKSKWVWATIILAILSIYVWRYTSLIEDLSEAYAQVGVLSESLKTTNESLDKVQSELILVSRYAQEREKRREQVNKDISDIKGALENERRNNEGLEECWNVPLSDSITKRMRIVPDKSED